MTTNTETNMYTIDEIDKRFKDRFAALAAKHGSPSAIPNDELHALNERMRAENVILIHGKADPGILRNYSIPLSIIEEYCGVAPAIEAKRTYRQRKQAVEQWCRDNSGSTVTPTVIAEIGDFSEATARTFINERPDLFTKVKRGYYLVRDPQAERKQA
jgi:hypothetical protein